MGMKEGVTIDVDRFPTDAAKARATVGSREHGTSVIAKVRANGGGVLSEGDTVKRGLAGIKSPIMFSVEYREYRVCCSGHRVVLDEHVGNR